MFRYYVNMYHCGFSDVITGLPGAGSFIGCFSGLLMSFQLQIIDMCGWQKIQRYDDYKTKSNLSNTIT